MFFGRLSRKDTVAHTFYSTSSHLVRIRGLPNWDKKSAAESSHEIHNHLLRPASVVAEGLGEKCAVSPVGGLEEVNVRIRYEFGAGRRQDANEGVVFGMDDQCGGPDV